MRVQPISSHDVLVKLPHGAPGVLNVPAGEWHNNILKTVVLDVVLGQLLDISRYSCLWPAAGTILVYA